MKHPTIHFMRTCSTLLLIIWLSISVQAQVGINNNNPDPSAALDIQSNNKGLLIPRISTTARIGMPSPANSILVFDTDLKKYFYYNNGWYPLNTLNTSITNNGLGGKDTISYTIGKIGIGLKNPTEQLEVSGNIKASGNLSAAKIYGEGTMPAGGIIMWSGSIGDIPTGWALCNGNTVLLPGGGSYATPNLSGRFIVGYQNGDTDYGTIGNVGPVFTDADGTSNGTNTYDARQIRLTANQSGLPSHTHGVTDNKHQHDYNDAFQTDATNGKLATSGNGESASSVWEMHIKRETALSESNISIQDATPVNAVSSFENRPPYFVLAYIIKLPY